MSQGDLVVAAPDIVLDGMLAEAARTARLFAQIAISVPDAELNGYVLRLERPLGDEVETAAALFLRNIFATELIRRSGSRGSRADPVRR